MPACSAIVSVIIATLFYSYFLNLFHFQRSFYRRLSILRLHGVHPYTIQVSITMPYRLDTHVLTVDANVIHKVDTGSPTDRYRLWTGELILYALTSPVLTSQSSLGA
jgi:hypothetical protein